ncbi:MAG: DUF3365 domain-containing protein [Desulfobacteraceae bacterium]|uniref:histidine kinase n=1 Tax=Candidatus Desulfacyla euxinica TaxID=2841693 RepID=A0A8J6N105_9DELT|nr:DUF3365 domain-containing protein [Candidatus Desulfacyla euxinica]MBL6977695.1 DUF3365 domain-containing protein [Desulfobacteraceae bacterium]
MRKYHLSLQVKFLLCITLIIFPTIGVIFMWEGIQREKQGMDQVMNQARILARQVILTRQWIADCGGIMVSRDSKGAKDTDYFYDDRLETSRGCYQRFTPAMVTKKLSEYSARQDLYRFRLASLTPLNPANSPDEFERAALIKFRKEGIAEIMRFNTHDNKQHLQYMVPLFLENACIRCHKRQGNSQNAIRGGLSVFLPIGDMKSSLARDQSKLAIAGVGLILLTIFTLFVLLRRLVIKPMKELERMTGEISRGNLDARVDIATGDQVEKLGHAFNLMAERLSRGRDFLEEKVKQATHELSEANRDLKSLDKLKSDFLANMSHELRSPLTVIRGGVDYLNRTIKGTENRNYLAIIDKNLARLIHLVSDLFDFTRIEAKRADWSFERENISGLVREVTEILSPLAMDKRVSIRCECPGDIYAEIDLERIEQVLVNLMENAIKFSDEGTKIQIDVKEDQDDVLVAVRDKGVGISEENLEVIFEKFHTLPSSGGKGKREGTGLGLAICKGIIEAHGGKIWAESVKGGGSTFFFTLPKQHS